MAKLSLSGFDEFSNELEKIIERVSDLDGKEISSEELFDDSGFVEKHTGFSTINDFLDQFGSDISDEDLENESSDTPFNKFIAKSTDDEFKTFSAFHEAAVDEYLKTLGF